jgi:diguanylate cyclase (GGDEF)-like protein
MQFDLPTMMTMQSFVGVCAGAALFVDWAHNRKISALALWGLVNIITAAGIFSLALGPALSQPLWTLAGGMLLVMAPGLMWKAARAFDAKPAPLVVALLGMVVTGVASGVPGLQDVAGSLRLVTSAVYLFAAALALWVGRKERLTARWPFIILIVVHAAAESVGAYSTFVGSISQDQVAPVMSVFGFVHFESIIFAIGTTISAVALVNERKEAATRMAANIDPLTGIANRGAFMDSGERIMERCRREGAPVSVMMFDLDRFKAVNDTYGHAVGDAVIRKFSEVAAAALRPNDALGRLGGEEFAVAMPGSSIEAAAVRADRICASFAESCRRIGDHWINAAVSGGVSVSGNGKHTLSALLEHADMALYRAKAAGGNCVKRADQPRPNGGSSNVYRVA